jgi:hypothetical protein
MKAFYVYMMMNQSLACFSSYRQTTMIEGTSGILRVLLAASLRDDRPTMRK